MSKIQSINFQNNYENSKVFANFKIPDISYVKYEKNNKELETKEKTKIFLGAFSGALIPVIVINSFRKGRISDISNAFQKKMPLKDKFKAIWNLFEIENYFQILATTTGGVLGGLLSGLKFAQNKEDKEAKYKEGIFEFLNNMTPTTLVALGLNQAKKMGKDKSLPLKAGIILSSVAGGMFIANKASNKINAKIFDKNKKEKDIREFKPTDCLVHIDDLVNLAVLAKIPFANKLQMDKLLPIIYARSGFEVGIADKK